MTQELRTKAGDTEKVTINLGLVDLGQIDLLVQEGFYSNRTDLIRTAVRNQLTSHAEVIRQTVARKSLVLGLQHFSRADLEAAQAALGTKPERATTLLQPRPVAERVDLHAAHRVSHRLGGNRPVHVSVCCVVHGLNHTPWGYPSVRAQRQERGPIGARRLTRRSFHRNPDAQQPRPGG